MFDRLASRLNGALLCSVAAHAALAAVLSLGGLAGHGNSAADNSRHGLLRVGLPVAPSEPAIESTADERTRPAMGPTRNPQAVQTAAVRPSGPVAQRRPEVREPDTAQEHVPTARSWPEPAPQDELAPELEPSGQYYFANSEVEVTARPLAEIEPVLPDGSELQAAYLVMRVLINELGTVDRVHLLISEPEGLFDEPVMAAFAAARFEPALREGFPVKSQKVVELKIDPELRAVPAIGAPVILHQSDQVR